MVNKKKYQLILYSVLVLFSVLIYIFQTQKNVIFGKEETSVFSLKVDKTTIEQDEKSTFSIEKEETEKLEPILIEYPVSYQIDLESIKKTSQSILKSVEENKEQTQLTLILRDTGKQTVNIEGTFTKTGSQKITVSMGNQTEQLNYQVVANETMNAEQNEDLEQLISSGIPLKQTRAAALPAFDWTKLNTDGVNLSEYTKQTKNTPVKLTGEYFDKQSRDYYLFNGHTTGTYTYSTGFSTNVVGELNRAFATTDDVGTSTTGPIPLLQTNIIGVKKQEGTESSTKLITYDFQFGTSASRSSTSFDIGEMSTPTGPIDLAMNAGTIYTSQLIAYGRSNAFLVSQYVKENETIYYGWIARAKPTLSGQIAQLPTGNMQPVRVQMKLVDGETGRVRTNIKFYNMASTTKYFAPTYGLHVDIGGAHAASKLYSNSTDGLYFAEDGLNVSDKTPYNLFFYTDDLYPTYDNGTGPTDFKVGDLGSSGWIVGAWNGLSLNTWAKSLSGNAFSSPYQDWDTPEPLGELYPLSHPVFAYRWDAIQVGANQVGSFDFDQGLTEKGKVDPQAEKNFKNITTGDASDNNVGDILEFQLKFSNKEAMSNWENVQVTDVMPKGLDVDTTSFKLIDSAGTETSLPSSIYTAGTRTIKTGSYTLAPDETYTIVFEAKIATGAQETTITNTMTALNTSITSETASASVALNVNELRESQLTVQFVNELGDVMPGYTVTIDRLIGDVVDLTKDANVQTQIEKVLAAGYEIAESPTNEGGVALDTPTVTVTYKVQGILSLTSAPAIIDFGTLKYNAATQRVENPVYETPLVVTDTRADAQSGWTITAALTAPLVNEDDKELANALRYVFKGQETILDTNAQAIYNNTVGKAGSFTVSDEWGTTTKSDGIKLQIDSGDTVYTGDYVGVITWKIMAGQP